MLDEIEVFYVDGDSAACDGGGGALGHPKVYMALDRTGRVVCSYCGRWFVRDPDRAGETETISTSEAAAREPSPGSTARH